MPRRRSPSSLPQMSGNKGKAKAVDSEANGMATGKRQRHPLDLLIHQILTNPGEVDIAMISKTYPNDANRAASEAYISQNWGRLEAFRNPVAVNGLIISCVLIWAISSNSHRTLMQELVTYCKSYLQLPASAVIPIHLQVPNMWYNIIYGHYIAGLARRDDLLEVGMAEIVRRYGTPEEIEACNRFSRKNQESIEEAFADHIGDGKSRDLRMEVMAAYLEHPQTPIFDRFQWAMDEAVKEKIHTLSNGIEGTTD